MKSFWVLVFSLPVLAGASVLRIASFNLEWLTATASENDMAPWRNESDLENHRRDLARILTEVNADVVCVLESTSKAALEKLLTEPGLRSMHYRVYDLESRDEATGQDAAFLSRVPVDKVDGTEVHDFQTEVRDPLTKRSVIFLTRGKVKIGFLGVHLLAHPDDPKRNRKRVQQALSATRILRDEIVSRGYAPIVLGDFNDFDPDVETVSGDNPPRDRVLSIVKNFDEKRPGDELFNVAERIQPISQRYSCYWDLNKNRRWNGGEPVSLIDHILIDQFLSSRIKHSQILHVPKDGSVLDHWPVIVELEL